MPEPMSKNKLVALASSLSHWQINTLYDVFVTENDEDIDELKNLCIQRKKMLDEVLKNEDSNED